MEELREEYDRQALRNKLSIERSMKNFRSKRGDHEEKRYNFEQHFKK